MKNYNADCILCREDIPHSHVTDEDFYPKVKPLTIEQVKSLWNKKIAENGFYVSFSDYREIAKDIEQAHGIGDKK